jgi:hypothetical protein
MVALPPDVVHPGRGRPCLAHCDHIVGTNIDQRAAIALAKAMIRDGRMPTPEEAERQLRERQEQARELPTANDVRGIFKEDALQGVPVGGSTPE